MMRSVSTIWGVLMMEQMKVEMEDDRKSSIGLSTRLGTLCSKVEFWATRERCIFVVYIDVDIDR